MTVVSILRRDRIRCSSRLRKNATKKRGKSFLQGPFVPQDKLKPVESTQFTSAPFEAQDELSTDLLKRKAFSAAC
jgi:hypothetical protein